MTLHDLRDIVDIYYSNPNGGVDYTWDRTPISIWNPNEQRKMEIYFTGSSRPGADGENDPGQINFNARYLDDIGGNGVMEAFDAIIGQIIDSKFDMTVNWKTEFMKKLIELRSTKNAND